MSLITNLVAAGAPLLAQVKDTQFWMPSPASAEAQQVDWLFYLLLWISVFFFTLIVGAMVFFVFKYRKREGHREQETPKEHLALELTWTIIPLIIVMIVFYYGFTGFMDMAVAPGNAYEIHVGGRKWTWDFTYPNGYVDKDLHVPLNVPVKLILSSDDVIHSLFIPAFRLKKDAVPGRYTKAWFTANRAGTFTIYCAEYCGTSHSEMLAQVIVHEPNEYKAWLEQASNFLDTMPPAEAGARLFTNRGCGQCHSVDGSGNIGPTVKGVFGHSVTLSGGGTVEVDENYLRESILDPAAKVVAGFEPVMPTYQGRLKDPEVTAIIEYIKSLAE